MPVDDSLESLTDTQLPPISINHQQFNMVGMSSSSSSIIPRWLQILLAEKFFSPCVVHECANKNEKNIFCLDCCMSICLHCSHTHPSHHLLQVRRYVYHDVLRLGDAQKLMNCSFVQPYTTNRAKVIFLHKRPMTRPFKSNGNFCMKCDRSLQDSYLFCSISCKIHHLVTSKSGIVNKSTVSLLFDRATSVSSSEIEDAAGQMTPASLLDFPSSPLRAYACTAAVDQPVAGKKKKRRVLLNPSRQRCSTTNRRKSVPNRAPLN
ncbi:hypothetical protein AB3S75_028573 [Citrus x aurantiifolia]